MKKILHFLLYIFSNKKIQWQGLILKKHFTGIIDNHCASCYLGGKNRDCPKNNKGELYCGEYIYFEKINKVKRGIGFSGKSYRFITAKCRGYKNKNRIKKEKNRDNK